MSKLIVLRRDENYRLEEELKIGKIILKSNEYKKYFSPIIDICPVDFQKINDNDKFTCNSSNKYPNSEMFLAKLNYINGTNVIDTLQEKNGIDCIQTFLKIFTDVLEGITFLVSKELFIMILNGITYYMIILVNQQK